VFKAIDSDPYDLHYQFFWDQYASGRAPGQKFPVKLTRTWQAGRLEALNCKVYNLKDMYFRILPNIHTSDCSWSLSFVGTWTRHWTTCHLMIIQDNRLNWRNCCHTILHLSFSPLGLLLFSACDWCQLLALKVPSVSDPCLKFLGAIFSGVKRLLQNIVAVNHHNRHVYAMMPSSSVISVRMAPNRARNGGKEVPIWTYLSPLTSPSHSPFIFPLPLLSLQPANGYRGAL